MTTPGESKKHHSKRWFSDKTAISLITTCIYVACAAMILLFSDRVVTQRQILLLFVTTAVFFVSMRSVLM
jgi:FtsH-binding integral membrane protein